MRLLDAEVIPVDAGARTLKEAVSAAIRDWVTNVRTTHYIIGSVVGPAPFPVLVRDLQRVIGDEAREQAVAAEAVLPARVIACVGGGSNAIGTFYAFLDDDSVELIGVEAGGEGLDGRHGASLAAGRAGILHGTLSSVLADGDGQILEAHSISAGLAYPGPGPEQAHLRDSGRARHQAVTDADALRALPEPARPAGAGVGGGLSLGERAPGGAPVLRRVSANRARGRGPGEFARLLAGAGPAGAIAPALPLEEAGEIGEQLSGAGIALVPLVAPTTPDGRRRRICERAEGFVYVVSDTRVTGERDELPDGIAR